MVFGRGAHCLSNERRAVHGKRQHGQRLRHRGDHERPGDTLERHDRRFRLRGLHRLPRSERGERGLLAHRIKHPQDLRRKQRSPDRPCRARSAGRGVGDHRRRGFALGHRWHGQREWGRGGHRRRLRPERGDDRNPWRNDHGVVQKQRRGHRWWHGRQWRHDHDFRRCRQRPRAAVGHRRRLPRPRRHDYDFRRHGVRQQHRGQPSGHRRDGELGGGVVHYLRRLRPRGERPHQSCRGECQPRGRPLRDRLWTASKHGAADQLADDGGLWLRPERHVDGLERQALRLAPRRHALFHGGWCGLPRGSGRRGHGGGIWSRGSLR